jgi:hypothetical protein
MAKHRIRTAACILATSCALSAAPAFAQQSTAVGALECDVAAGVGIIVTSSKALNCFFFPNTGAAPEHYVGTISKFGIDIGATGPGHLDWAVFTPTTGIAPGAIAGEYGGVGASATAGVGLGANALIGGSNRAVSLQPFSIQAQTGIDVAAGVTSLSLEYVPPPQVRVPLPPRRHR